MKAKEKKGTPKADHTSQDIHSPSLTAVLESDETELDQVVIERLLYLTHVNERYQRIAEIVKGNGTLEEIRQIMQADTL